LKRRILTITVAVLLAAIGTLSVLVYVHQANTRAVQGMKAVSVIVAKGSIPSGTSAGQAVRDGLLGSQTLPAGSVPVDALRSITPDLAGLVTTSPVQSGQLLTRAMLVAASQVTGGVAIPKGMIAVTIQMCPPEAVAGYVTAGSYVAVFDTYSRKSLDVQESCNSSHQVQAAGAVVTSMVLPRVEVLSVGQAPASSQAASSGGTGALTGAAASPASSQGAVLVTLAVRQADAERLINLDEAGLPYLALLTATSHTGFDTTTPTPLIQLHP
jgi:pilus assembly protein CpaB